MTTHMTPQGFAPLATSPGLHAGPRTNNYNSWKEIKSEMDCNGYSMDSYNQGSYQGNSESLPSCMFSSFPVSPSMTHPLQFSERAPHYNMAGSKENNFFREVPQCRRRLDFNHNAFMDMSKPVPVAVAKRNERERNRVKLINMTFQTLRQHLPVAGCGSKGKARKLSKVQTLRSAIDYIKKLEDLINNKNQERQLLDKGDLKVKAAKILGRHIGSSGVVGGDGSGLGVGVGGGGGGGSVEQEVKDYLPLNVAGMSVDLTTCVGYNSLYKRHGASSSSPGGSQGDFYSTDHNMSSPENHGSATSSTADVHQEPSPLSEASSYEVTAAEEDEDEFLDFDFWF